jgi:membrane-bound lytic murein transglycosylase D
MFSMQIVKTTLLTAMVATLAACATSPKAKRVVTRSKHTSFKREIQSELVNLQNELRDGKVNPESALALRNEAAKAAAMPKEGSTDFMGPSRVQMAENASLHTPHLVPYDINQIDTPQITGQLPEKKIPVLVNPEFAAGEIANDENAEITVLSTGPLKSLKNFEDKSAKLKTSSQTMVFELPVTYNARVRRWINYFQTEGRQSFRRYLERSTRWLPYIHNELEAAHLPMDIMYVALVESGFMPDAASPAGAVGMWQFIRDTGKRYGLRNSWWIDERRDVYKSTRAAVRYMTDLHKMFGSWYLVAASYNMGENGVQRLIKRHNSNDFWELADRGALPDETVNYVPKIIAAMLIAKAPALYGFRDLQYSQPYVFDYFEAPGGIDLGNLANYLGVSSQYLRELNPELLHGLIPAHVRSHRIRIPKGAVTTVAKYVDLVK